MIKDRKKEVPMTRNCFSTFIRTLIGVMHPPAPVSRGIQPGHTRDANKQGENCISIGELSVELLSDTTPGRLVSHNEYKPNQSW